MFSFLKGERGDMLFFAADKMVPSRAGFSLVELAISITVIGVLLALVVKGGDMIENAKVSSTVLQIESYASGIEGFRETYHQWPGDYDAAQAYIRDCTTANVCSDGDGNGAIGSATSSTSLLASVFGWSETLQVWRHLFLAGFGAGLAGGTDTEFGSILPASSLEGGFEMYYVWTPPSGADQGHFLRYTGLLSGVSLASGEGVSGFAARSLDRKMDDENPRGGRLFSTNIGSNTCLKSDGTYNEDFLEQQDCVVFIRVDG